MKWFKEVFLPSMEDKFNNPSNPKYRNQVILTERQYNVCLRYMKQVQCYGEYGDFYIYEFETGNARYTLSNRGRYHFLYKRVMG